MKYILFVILVLTSCKKEDSHKIPLDAFNTFNSNEIMISYFEMNKDLRHKAIPPKLFEVKDLKLIEKPNILPSFVHLRNIFLDTSSQKIYFFDHGVDQGEFLGEKLKSYSFKTNEVQIENLGKKKFYFNGVTFSIGNNNYEFYSGPEFLDILKNGKTEKKIQEILEENKVKAGFLSFAKFETKEFLGVYLGASEFSNIKKMYSSDYILKFYKNDAIELIEVKKDLPSSWGTVEVAMMDLDEDGDSDFVLSQHNMGYNQYRIGKVLSSKNYQYEELFKSKDGSNQWISQIYKVNNKMYFLVRGGSNGGDCTTLVYIENQVSDLHKCYLKVMKVSGRDFLIDYDLNLSELN